jgi:NAD(P)-dependent dehydrogenase (short-subunit alcohol dehydrogenase family)
MTGSKTPNATTRAVLITGCSTGIGRATAEYLAANGFTVFATVRKAADAESLGQLNQPNLIPVCPLDLSNAEDIANAIVFIKKELEARGIDGLYSVVNNAGGGSVAPIELMEVGKFRTEVETRVLGPVALLQGLLPLIRQAQGRILWIVTPSIIPIPYVSSIHACDYAVNCIARTLQIELKSWNIPSVMIRCGGVRTAAPAKSDRELVQAFDSWPRERFALYEEAMKKEQKELSAFDEKRTDPVEIAGVVHRALVAAKPKRRYQIGYLSGVAAGLEYLPQTWVDRIMEWRG